MSEKTEQPTPKKLRDARKKGQVANSKDVTSTALLIVIFCYLGLSRVKILKLLMELIEAPSFFFNTPFEQALQQTLMSCLKVMIVVVLPLLVIVIFVGVFANVLQVGPMLAPETVMPKFDKLNPISKLKQIFSIKNLIEFLKSAAKILFLSVLLYFVIRNVLDPLLKIPFLGLSGLMQIMPPVLKIFAYNVAFAYIVVAFLDFIFQRHNHTKQLMMSKDEIKREYKETEGDPTIKSKRKQFHRELLQGGPVEKTKKSSVLVTNPTHYAIALFYDGVTVTLPVVLAKGVGFQAQLMKKAAMDFEIPIMENVPLAHALYDLSEVGRYIPRELIEPVAEVIRWVKEQKDAQSSQEKNSSIDKSLLAK